MNNENGKQNDKMTNWIKIRKLSDEIGELHDEIGKLNDGIDELNDEIDELNNEIAEANDLSCRRQQWRSI